MKQTLLILILMIPGSALFAQPVSLSLEDAVSAAMTGNREIAAAQKRADQASSKVTQAWGALLPSVESQLSGTRQHADFGLTSLSDGAYDIRLVQLSLGVNPGVLYHSVRIASEENAVAKEEIRRMRHQVTSDVIRGYFSIVRANQILEIRKDSLAQLEANYRDVTNLYKNGSISRFDLLQSEVQMKSARPLVLEAENMVSTSVDAFNLALGSPAKKYTALTDNADKPALKLSSDDESVLSQLTQTAIKNRPDIIEIRLRREQAQHASSAQQSLYLWPTFSLGGNYGWNRNLANAPSAASGVNPAVSGAMSQTLSSMFGGDSWQNTWQIRAGATYRWDGLLPFSAVSGKKKEADASAEEAAIMIAQIRQSIEVAVRRDYFAMKTAFETLASREDNIATAKEGLRIASESYREGIARSSELLSAESALTGARGAYIDALYAYYSSRADLQRDTGVDAIDIFFTEELR